MNKISIIRKQVDDLLTKDFPTFKYKGHGANIGLWEMQEMETLSKPIGDSFWIARFRITVFVPNRYGQQILIEAYIISCYEWERLFEGYISDISDISKILNFQFGIPKKAG